jgi:hypothetical protein
LGVGVLALFQRAGQPFQNVAHFLYMSAGSLSTGSVVTHLPSSSLRKKQLSRPVWQAMPPAWSTRSRIASESQSSRISRTFCVRPDSSPLRQSFLRERDQ